MERRWPLTDGYEYTGRGHEIALIDPVDCPAGHPVVWGQRGWRPCPEHHGHPTWTCKCGQDIYRWQGRFVGALPCR